MELFSILLPAHDEEANVAPLCRELVAVRWMQKRHLTYRSEEFP